jgi:hypothetical protein
MRFLMQWQYTYTADWSAQQLVLYWFQNLYLPLLTFLPEAIAVMCAVNFLRGRQPVSGKNLMEDFMEFVGKVGIMACIAAAAVTILVLLLWLLWGYFAGV